MIIVPFTNDLIEDAAKLLALRHQKDRLAMPVLPTRFESERDAAQAIHAEWEKAGAQGVAAMEKGSLIGYLFGTRGENPARGRHVWMRMAGHSIAEGQPVDLYRDLYAAAAQLWVDEGYFAHYSLLPAHDAALANEWFRLGFGHEQVHGCLSLDAFEEGPAREWQVLGAQLRLATPKDRQALSDVSQWIRTYQAQSPIFGVALPEDAQTIRDGYARLGEDPDVDVWIVEKERRILSFQAYFPAEEEPAAMLVPSNGVELGVAATQPEFRGLGINHALTQHGLAQAKAKGKQYVLTDWRMTNLQSSRYWPRQGFLPIAYRLSRYIDPRIAWARG
ncbi:GNAT family N-acetyltransferase [Brevibacillus choshinensis]|uniref:GNAT family N-acetyltransferase n=1 Tax=Brevibacillus choshinensis TaxID=54911 RepID=A0ABX7FQF1_BRECH|nr:GNAT family N-acetyltransferase [Brevibacillus choshinensis]QRG68478.1 GNAT family N-acetyltransferase [Brevibacillus choshinensis]